MESVRPGENPSADASAATIAEQRAEIQRLKRRPTDDRFAQDLRDALTTASATRIIGSPVNHSRLLKTIVATASDIVEARAAALFLIDADHKDLVLEAAVGDDEAESERFRIPLGHGVAGLVAQNGQSMAIADTPEDDLDAADIGHPLGFNPRSVLCMPISFDDRVIGVLQFLDKEAEDDDEATFGDADMQAIGLFAHLAAVTIEQSRTDSRIGALVAELIANVDGLPDFDRHGLTERARAFTAELGQQTGYLHALDLARLVHEIVQYGDAATEACKGILNSFAEFLRSRPVTVGEQGGLAW
jgi:GAF domain-containing protein